MNNVLMSEQIDQLATALSKAQLEFEIARKNKSNPFFKSKYADLEEMIRVSRPSLCKYGLSVSQFPMIEEEKAGTLITLLLHSSGQWLKSTVKYSPAKTDIQSLASNNTSLKRMAYAGIVGIATSDEDDDSDTTVHSFRSQRVGPTEISYLQAMPEATQQKILAYNKVSRLDELTMEQYDNMIARSKNRSDQ